MTMYTKSGTTFHETRDLRVLEGGAFRRVQKAWVLDDLGTWQEFYTYIPTRDTTVTASAPSSVTNGPVSITGSVKDALTGDLVSDALSVELYNGATKLLTSTTSGGNYSFSWSPTTTGSFTLTVKVVSDGYWLASQVNTSAITVKTTAVASATWPSYAVIGQPFTVSGKVTPTLSGTVPGTVALQAYDSGTWTTLASATLSSSAYSISWTPPASRHGAQSLRVRYLGSGNFLADDSLSVSKTVYQPTPDVPSQTISSLTHTSTKMTVTDQANVDRFVIKCIETGNTVTVNSTGVAGASLTSASWGLSINSTYNFTITAYSDHPTAPTRTGNTLTVTTGRPAQTDSGSATITFSAADTGSWRPADGWSYLGNRIAQGYYSSSNGPYYGIARFDPAWMRSVLDNYGTPRSGRSQHATCTGFKVYAVREAGGTNAAVPISWYLSTADPGVGGQPALSPMAGTASPSGLAVGTSGWMTLPSNYNTWGDTLLNKVNGYQSVAMYYNGGTNYSIYSGGSNFKLAVTYSWNWTPVTYVAPTWKSS